jgi:hypothetical protein
MEATMWQRTNFRNCGRRNVDCLLRKHNGFVGYVEQANTNNFGCYVEDQYGHVVKSGFHPTAESAQKSIDAFFQKL